MSETPQPIAPPEGGHKMLKRILIGVVVFLVGLVLVAEIGVVKLETTETSWKTESQYETSRETLNRRAVLLQGFRFVPTIKVTVPSGSGKAIADQAADAIRKASPGGASMNEAKLEITIGQLTTDGAPWLPFYKQGSCNFTANYMLEASAAGSSISVRGQITGKVEQSTKGLCSTGLFRETMSKAIAGAIVTEINKMIAKNG